MNVHKMKELCSQLSEAVKLFKEECSRISHNTSIEQENINANCNEATQRVEIARNAIEQDCLHEQSRRQTVIRQTLCSVNSELNDIHEPHWHRMKNKYYESAKNEITSDYRDISADELFAELNRLLNELYRETQQLRGAFVPPGIANAIGSVVRPYRKKTYKKLARLREKILRCAEAIVLKSDIQDRKTFAESIKRDKVAEIEAEASTCLALLPRKEEEAIEAKSKLLFAIAENLVNQGILDKNEVAIGNLVVRDAGYEVIKHFPREYAEHLTREGLSIPLSLSKVDSNIFFNTSNDEKMSDVFAAIAVNILSQDIDSKIVFSDIECIGGSYASLSKIEKEGRAAVWRTEEDLRRGLETVCQDISDTYRDILGDTYQSLQEYRVSNNLKSKANTYIFIDNVNTVQGTARELLRRIIKNGNRAGVYVFLNISNDVSLSRNENGFFEDIINGAECFSINNGSIAISENIQVHLESVVDKSKVNMVCNCSKLMHQQKSIVHLGPKLPQSGCWQKKSSKDNIQLSIGVDQNGENRTLVLSEDKPYALIIGDVDAGKSSLLHAILIQTMANYDDSEVKIAIGDFKDGAEFNIYATSNLKSVETVVDNEDPDVMASFLNFYIGEMRKRQALFEQLELCTNKLVRKYETYRAVWEESGRMTPAMPRILLVIDEYQSLFENIAGTATMLNELVRKGRTYGIHIVMASQRATSDNPRNSFTGDLKNYFTSRFVFRAPQTAARSMLSERCADTGKENSGISRAALLNKGCAIYNSYMGQTEKDNCEIQCYYATDELIGNVCKVLSAIHGTGTSILLKKNACSVTAPDGNNAEIGLGTSPCLRVDAGSESCDDIYDDTFVTLNARRSVNNVLCSGSDERIALSVLKSAIRHVESFGVPFEIHVFGADNSKEIDVCLSELRAHSNTYFHTTELAVKEELSRQVNSVIPCINLFIELTDFPVLAQTSSALRTTPESDMLKQVVSETSTVKRINILRSRSFRNVRSSFSQVLNATSIYILGVGETENIRSATSDGCRITNSEYDVPKKNAINAYYYNKNTDKFGKVILYRM